MTTVPEFLERAKGYKGSALDGVLKGFEVSDRAVREALAKANGSDEYGCDLAMMLLGMSKTQRLKAAKTFAARRV